MLRRRPDLGMAASPYTWHDPGNMKTLESNIPYVQSRADAQRENDCRLDVVAPDAGNHVPTVIWFHGGGLNSGERYVPGELMDLGFAIVPVSYRLSPRVQAPAYIEDAAAAVAWVFSNLDRWGGDRKRVVVAGASAGGYLAGMVVLDKRWLGHYQIDANAVAGLVSLSGQAITHFTVREERGMPGHQAVVDDLAPLYHVRPDAPPILLVTGDRDLELLGRYEENAYFLRMLQVAGHRDHALHELKGRDHAGVEAAGHAYLIDFVRRVCGL
ncbi:MAG: alpha/beta hydrolase [Kiritimatiellae bacterium]|nr:alpha/beta hydrolase [Kiritimatiellia bacterium]